MRDWPTYSSVGARAGASVGYVTVVDAEFTSHPLVSLVQTAAAPRGEENSWQSRSTAAAATDPE